MHERALQRVFILGLNSVAAVLSKLVLEVTNEMSCDIAVFPTGAVFNVVYDCKYSVCGA
jgi:hypothetical protein